MAQKKFKTVICPTCGQPVEWRPENKFRPFCSERCKLMDLGSWAAEQYRIPLENDPMQNEGNESGA